jgi:uncharacterized repeat protein (TIGR01451 family)
MPLSLKEDLAVYFQQLLRRLRKGRGHRRGAASAAARRALLFEPLEGRALLATDLATITGEVSLNLPVPGATVQLFEDDGDGVFDSTVDGPAIRTAITNATGRYTFDRLEAGGYFIRQPAQTVGATELGEFISQLITFTPAQAAGIAGTTVDDFNNPTPQTIQANSVATTASSFADHVGALGGERDLSVQFLSGVAGDLVEFDSRNDGQIGRLQFSASVGAQGLFTATYDGNDDDAVVIDFDGLGGADLTDGAGSNVSNSFVARARADQLGTLVRLRVYSDSVSFSDSPTLTIPGDNEDSDLVFEFADFTTATGASAPADFTDVGAIQLIVETTTDGTDGRLTLLGAFAPTVFTLDIPNHADLSLTKEVNDTTPNINQQITFTIIVANAGEAGATNILVRDVIPNGMAFVNASATQGTYDNNTSIWTVGDIARGAGATLTINATVLTPGLKINTAEIIDADQPDDDSIPGNGVAGEDDQQSVNITPAQIDLSVSKTVDDDTPNANQEIVFRVTVANAGPDQATGVLVEDDLPGGLTFVSAIASQGTYDSGTGIWTVGTINSAANATLDITARLTTIGQKTNTAAVVAANEDDIDSTPNNNVPAEDDQFSITIIPIVADLSVTKGVDDPTPALNTNVAFTIRVLNAGPDAATGIALRDALPAGLEFVFATPTQGTYSNTTGIWNVGTINSSSDATLTIVATVRSTAPITNTAELTAADQFDSDSTPNNQVLIEDDIASATVDAPDTGDLSLIKTVNDSTPIVGQDVTFTVTLTNDGPDAVSGVQVTDALPAGLNFDSATPSQGTYTSATGIWAVGALNGSTSATLILVATVTTPGDKTNAAQVTASNQPDPDSVPGDGQGDDFDDVVLDVQPSADLELDMTIDDTTPVVGQTVTFTLTLTNDGPDAASGITVTDLLPSGLVFVPDNPPNADYNGTTGVWSVGDLAVAASETLTIRARVTSSAPITNAAEVTASSVEDPDSTPGNGLAEDDRDTVAIDAPLAADLDLNMTIDDTTPDVGQTVTFTLTLVNDGPDAASGVTVTDLLPAGLTFVPDNPPNPDYNSTTGAWSVGSLASGATETLTIRARLTSSAPIANSAEVTAVTEADPDSTPGDGQGDDFVSVQVDAPSSADLRLDMTIDDTSPDFSQTVTFTLVLTNDGPDSAPGVAVTDQLPSGLTFISANPTADYNSTTGIWSVGDLANGASETLTIVARVTSTAPITNSAQVTASGVADPDSTPGDGQGDDFDSVQIDVPNFADLSLDLQSSSATPNFNSTVTFTITLTNSGPEAATGVTVTDQLPSGLTFVSANPAVDYNSTTGVWTVGDLASGATDTLTIVARVTNTSSITNTAQVTASAVPDPDSTPNDGQGDDFDSVQIDAPAAADLSITNEVNNPTAAVGQNVVFTVVVSNAGPDQATGVVVTDQLPAGLSFVSSSPTQGTYNSTTGVWTVGSINSGASATLTITATVTGTGPKTTTARVTASDQSDPDSTPGNTADEDDQAAATVTPPTRFSKRLFLAR